MPQPSTTATIVGEVVGSFLLAVLGLGIGAASFVYGGQEDVSPWFGDIWPTSFGWGLSIALAIYCTASLSGAHFNPAVTLALAVTGRHPWNQVPRYIVCQLIGWFLGAAVIVALFGGEMSDIANARGIEYGDPDSWSIASVLTTYVPNPGVFGTGAEGFASVPIGIGFLGEVLGTGILLLVILSLLETRHANAPAAWFFPLIVGFTVGVLIMMLAGLSQASFNPARDLGPRLMLLVMGFGEVAIPGPRDGLALMVTTIGPIVGGVLGALFHDHVMRPQIPGVSAEPVITSPGEMARGDARAAEPLTALGHAPVMPATLGYGGGNGATEGPGDIDLVMLDMGGTMYDDDNTAQANLQAVRDLAGAAFDEREFWRIYDETRQAQVGMQKVLSERFLGGGKRQELADAVARNLFFRPESLYADVRPTIAVLSQRYKLGIASNNNPIHEALRRDGLLEYFTVIATPETSGADKTDAAFWRWALERAGVPAERAVHVGNRLDSDIRPVRQVGMRAVWLLRGECPPSPTVEQLSEPNAVVTTFSGLPNALAGMAAARTPAGVA